VISPAIFIAKGVRIESNITQVRTPFSNVIPFKSNDFHLHIVMTAPELIFAHMVA